MIYLPRYWAPTSLCIPSCTSEKPTRNSLTLSSHTRFFHVSLPWGHPIDFSSHSRLLIFFPHQTICCSPNFPFMYLSKWFPLLEITSLLSFVWSGNFWSFQNRIQMLPPRGAPPHPITAGSFSAFLPSALLRVSPSLMAQYGWERQQK